MDEVNTILPYLWKLIEKRKCAINVSRIDNEVVVNIIERFRKYQVKAADSMSLIPKLIPYLQ
jgi:hypothetical protein